MDEAQQPGRVLPPVNEQKFNLCYLGMSFDIVFLGRNMRKFARRVFCFFKICFILLDSVFVTIYKIIFVNVYLHIIYPVRFRI